MVRLGLVKQYGLSSVKKNELGDAGIGNNRHCKRLDRFQVSTRLDQHSISEMDGLPSKY